MGDGRIRLLVFWLFQSSSPSSPIRKGGGEKDRVWRGGHTRTVVVKHKVEDRAVAEFKDAGVPAAGDLTGILLPHFDGTCGPGNHGREATRRRRVGFVGRIRKGGRAARGAHDCACELSQMRYACARLRGGRGRGGKVEQTKGSHPFGRSS